jgi:hypothetical protein
LVTAPWDDTMWYDRALPLFWRTVLPHFLSWTLKQYLHSLETLVNDLPDYTAVHPRKH